MRGLLSAALLGHRLAIHLGRAWICPVILPLTRVSVSNTPGASIVTEFEGNAVYIYGGLAPSYGVMDVTIDGDATTRINCSSAIPRPNTLLVS